MAVWKDLGEVSRGRRHAAEDTGDDGSHMHGIIGEAEISCPFSFVLFVDFVDNIYVLLST